MSLRTDRNVRDLPPDRLGPRLLEERVGFVVVEQELAPDVRRPAVHHPAAPRLDLGVRGPVGLQHLLDRERQDVVVPWLAPPAGHETERVALRHELLERRDAGSAVDGEHDAVDVGKGGDGAEVRRRERVDADALARHVGGRGRRRDPDVERAGRDLDRIRAGALERGRRHEPDAGAGQERVREADEPLDQAFGDEPPRVGRILGPEGDRPHCHRLGVVSNIKS
jgi:hypothetical protein